MEGFVVSVIGWTQLCNDGLILSLFVVLSKTVSCLMRHH